MHDWSNMSAVAEFFRGDLEIWVERPLRGSARAAPRRTFGVALRPSVRLHYDRIEAVEAGLAGTNIGF